MDEFNAYISTTCMKLTNTKVVSIFIVNYNVAFFVTKQHLAAFVRSFSVSHVYCSHLFHWARCAKISGVTG